MELNEQYKVEFVDIDYEGRGVCKLENNFPIFVPDALKGERALIEITNLKKNHYKKYTAIISLIYSLLLKTLQKH